MSDKQSAPIAHVANAPVPSAVAPSTAIRAEPVPSAVAPSTAIRAEPPLSLLGEWEGTGLQSDGSTWAMRVNVTSLREGNCAEISYPSLSCGGVWQCATTSDGRTLSAIEHLTHGFEECVDRGTITMTLDADGLHADWKWRGAKDQGDALARLQRLPSPND